MIDAPEKKDALKLTPPEDFKILRAEAELLQRAEIELQKKMYTFAGQVLMCIMAYYKVYDRIEAQQRTQKDSKNRGSNDSKLKSEIERLSDKNLKINIDNQAFLEGLIPYLKLRLETKQSVRKGVLRQDSSPLEPIKLLQQVKDIKEKKKKTSGISLRKKAVVREADVKEVKGLFTLLREPQQLGQVGLPVLIAEYKKLNENWMTLANRLLNTAQQVDKEQAAKILELIEQNLRKPAGEDLDMVITCASGMPRLAFFGNVIIKVYQTIVDITQKTPLKDEVETIKKQVQALYNLAWVAYPKFFPNTDNKAYREIRNLYETKEKKDKDAKFKRRELEEQAKETDYLEGNLKEKAAIYTTKQGLIQVYQLEILRLQLNLLELDDQTPDLKYQQKEINRQIIQMEDCKQTLSGLGDLTNKRDHYKRDMEAAQARLSILKKEGKSKELIQAAKIEVSNKSTLFYLYETWYKEIVVAIHKAGKGLVQHRKKNLQDNIAEKFYPVIMEIGRKSRKSPEIIKAFELAEEQYKKAKTAFENRKYKASTDPQSKELAEQAKFAYHTLMLAEESFHKHGLWLSAIKKSTQPDQPDQPDQPEKSEALLLAHELQESLKLLDELESAEDQVNISQQKLDDLQARRRTNYVKLKENQDAFIGGVADKYTNKKEEEREEDGEEITVVKFSSVDDAKAKLDELEKDVEPDAWLKTKYQILEEGRKIDQVFVSDIEKLNILFSSQQSELQKVGSKISTDLNDRFSPEKKQRRISQKKVPPEGKFRPPNEEQNLQGIGSQELQLDIKSSTFRDLQEPLFSPPEQLSKKEDKKEEKKRVNFPSSPPPVPPRPGAQQILSPRTSFSVQILDYEYDPSSDEAIENLESWLKEIDKINRAFVGVDHQPYLSKLIWGKVESIGGKVQVHPAVCQNLKTLQDKAQTEINKLKIAQKKPATGNYSDKEYILALSSLAGLLNACYDILSHNESAEIAAQFEYAKALTSASENLVDAIREDLGNSKDKNIRSEGSPGEILYKGYGALGDRIVDRFEQSRDYESQLRQTMLTKALQEQTRADAELARIWQEYEDNLSRMNSDGSIDFEQEVDGNNDKEEKEEKKITKLPPARVSLPPSSLPRKDQPEAMTLDQKRKQSQILVAPLITFLGSVKTGNDSELMRASISSTRQQTQFVESETVYYGNERDLNIVVTSRVEISPTDSTSGLKIDVKGSGRPGSLELFPSSASNLSFNLDNLTPQDKASTADFIFDSELGAESNINLNEKKELKIDVTGQERRDSLPSSASNLPENLGDVTPRDTGSRADTDSESEETALMATILNSEDDEQKEKKYKNFDIKQYGSMDQSSPPLESENVEIVQFVPPSAQSTDEVIEGGQEAKSESSSESENDGPASPLDIRRPLLGQQQGAAAGLPAQDNNPRLHRWGPLFSSSSLFNRWIVAPSMFVGSSAGILAVAIASSSLGVLGPVAKFGLSVGGASSALISGVFSYSLGVVGNNTRRLFRNDWEHVMLWLARAQYILKKIARNERASRHDLLFTDKFLRTLRRATDTSTDPGKRLNTWIDGEPLNGSRLRDDRAMINRLLREGVGSLNSESAKALLKIVNGLATTEDLLHEADDVFIGGRPTLSKVASKLLSLGRSASVVLVPASMIAVELLVVFSGNVEHRTGQLLDFIVNAQAKGIISQAEAAQALVKAIFYTILGVGVAGGQLMIFAASAPKSKNRFKDYASFAKLDGNHSDLANVQRAEIGLQYSQQLLADDPHPVIAGDFILLQLGASDLPQRWGGIGKELENWSETLAFPGSKKFSRLRGETRVKYGLNIAMAVVAGFGFFGPLAGNPQLLSAVATYFLAQTLPGTLGVFEKFRTYMQGAPMPINHYASNPLHGLVDPESNRLELAHQNELAQGAYYYIEPVEAPQVNPDQHVVEIELLPRTESSIPLGQPENKTFVPKSRTFGFERKQSSRPISTDFFRPGMTNSVEPTNFVEPVTPTKLRAPSPTPSEEED